MGAMKTNNDMDREGDAAAAAVEATLAQARDIARRVLGRASGDVLAAVFRELCYQREQLLPEEPCTGARPLH